MANATTNTATDTLQRPSLVEIFQKSKGALGDYKDNSKGEAKPLTAEEKAAFGSALDVMVDYVVTIQGQIAPGGGQSFLKELKVSSKDPNRAKYTALFRAVLEMKPEDGVNTLTEKIEQELMKNGCPASRPSLVSIYELAKTRLGTFKFNDNGQERALTVKEKAALEKAIDAMIAIIKSGQDKLAPSGGNSFLKKLQVSPKDPKRAGYIALFRAVTEMNPADNVTTLTEKVEQDLMKRTCPKKDANPVVKKTAQVQKLSTPAPTATVPEDTRTRFQKAGAYAADVLKFDGLLAGGATSYPSVREQVPYEIRPAGDRELPNLKLRLNLGTPDEPVVIIGSAKDKAIKKTERHFELLGNARLAAQDTIYSDKSSVLFSAGFGLEGRVNFWGKKLSLGLSSDQGIDENSYRDPDRFFYTGAAKNWTPGLSLSSNFGTNWLVARVFAERQFTWFNWDGNSFPGGFSGNTELYRLGAAAKLNLAKLTASVKGALLTGKTEVPPQGEGTYEHLSGYEVGARIDSKQLGPYQFHALFGLSRLNQSGWGTLSNITAGAGIKHDSVGALEARGSLITNPGLYYGSKANTGSLAYNLPDRLGRASALGAALIAFQVDKQTGYGGLVTVNPLRAIFGEIKRYEPKAEEATAPVTPAPVQAEPPKSAATANAAEDGDIARIKASKNKP